MSNDSIAGTRGHVVCLVNGPPMSEEESARHWSVLRQVAAARNTFDPEMLIALFAPDGVYESQNISEPIQGIDAIGAYLRKRFAFIREASLTRDTGRFLPGLVDLPHASEHPCLIGMMEAKRTALWVMKLTDEGLIRRFDILTVVPPASIARELDGFPGSLH